MMVSCEFADIHSLIINFMQQVVLMVKCVLLEVAVRLREQWKCVTTRHGEWCLD